MGRFNRVWSVALRCESWVVALTLAVISHDAGGAELLASYVARGDISCHLVLDGPAVKVFERRLGDIETVSLDVALDNCDEFLTGTSWQSDLEWRAIGMAQAAGKSVSSFLDHWGNYGERFLRGGVQHLPNALWVGDEIAKNLAQLVFPLVPVHCVGNPYFDDIRETVAELDAGLPPVLTAGVRVLFVCEPLTEHGLKEYDNPLYWGYTEYDALRYFFSNRAALGKRLTRLVIRPHPSEMAGKYDEIASEFGDVACVGGRKSLLEEIAESDVVVGCESMAMVVGLIAGRRVIAAIPPGGLPCALPQVEIESLQVLLKSKKNAQ